MRKAEKSELIRELKDTKHSLSEFQELHEICDRNITVVDFMAYARKLQTWVNLGVLDNTIIHVAEQFLLKCMPKSS